MRNTERLKLFAKISAVLTGFNVMELWGTSMMETYFYWVNAQTKGAELDSFYAEFEKVFTYNVTDEAIDRAVADSIMPKESFGGLANAIITLWYLGQWTCGEGEKAKTYIPTPEAYQQGLIWLIGQTHPPGAKQPGYGSWATTPDK